MLALSSAPQPATRLKRELRTTNRLLTFDQELFPLRELVQAAVGVEALDKLHLYEPEDFLPKSASSRGSAAASRGAQRRVELLRHSLNERWKGSAERKLWERELLPRLVREVVGPCSMAGEERLLYQRSPLLRFHVAWPAAPGEVVAHEPPTRGFGRAGHSPKPPGALAMLHTDHDTGHPSSEVNFLLPVTPRICGANSLWVETAPGRQDYRPFEMSYGELMQWHGNSLAHYSHRNTLDETRVSFDFRVIPGSAWAPPHPKSLFQLNTYYLDALAPPAPASAHPHPHGMGGGASRRRRKVAG